MKLKKIILALVLIASLCLLCACGDSKDGAESTGEGDVSQSEGDDVSQPGGDVDNKNDDGIDLR